LVQPAPPYRHIVVGQVYVDRKVTVVAQALHHVWNAELERRKLNLKAKFEGDSSYYSFKRSVPGSFNMGFIGSTGTALPSSAMVKATASWSLDVAAQAEFGAKPESSLTHFSFKRLVPGAFNVGLTGSTCTTLP
jgi:hypothetical protein